MNKNILTLATALFVGGSLFLTSCKKDTTAPVITLTGDSVQTVSLNAVLTDPGATANDDKDGAITAITSDYLTKVNKDLAGTYSVTYSASDSKDNQGTKTRTVIVRNDAYAWEGSYDYHEVSDTIYDFTDGIKLTLSTTNNNQVTFDKFAHFNDAAVLATISGNTFTAAQQTFTCGTHVPQDSHTFSVPSGTLTGTGTSGSKINISYTDKNNTLNSGPFNYTAVYTKK